VRGLIGTRSPSGGVEMRAVAYGRALALSPIYDTHSEGFSYSSPRWLLRLLPADDESRQIIFSLARRRLLNFRPDGTKRLFRQHRPKCDIGIVANTAPANDVEKSGPAARGARMRGRQFILAGEPHPSDWRTKLLTILQNSVVAVNMGI